ncbi:MAG: M28 family peptidase [Candidatus Aminicenantes bacterium]
MNKAKILIPIAISMIWLGSNIFLAKEEQPDDLWRFSALSAAWEIEYENRLKELLSSQRAEEHLRWITSKPHLAGSERTRVIAESLHKYMEEYGFKTETACYDGYLSAPVSVSARLVEPVQEAIPTIEDHIEGDPFTDNVEEHPGWILFSPSGEARGHVVYAHHGSERDLRTLEEMGINLKGKILLIRYFRTSDGRKIRNAEKFGAAGVVLYADPQEDGYPYGDVYPKGNWRPPGSIMRRSVIFDYVPSTGDPLSPGWASVKDARRLKIEEVAFPQIPALAISYRSAEHILKLMEGPTAPRNWQGALGVTYKLGPGPAKLHIQTEMDNRDRHMFNVIGRLEGSEHPDQWVLIGNHHDAIIYGGGDPSSGTASQLELARAFGELAEQGFRPKRTIIICFWDAEEMFLGGSTEWVEEHAQELSKKAVAYINMDSSVFNTERPLSVRSHTGLHKLFRAVARDIDDPRTHRSLFNVWRDLQNQFRQVPSVDGWGLFFDPDKRLSQPYVFEIPWDDAAPFYYYLALPSSDMYYGADYGMYHSIYDNFHWMKTVADPTFEYHILMSKLQGMMALRLANADLLPVDFVEEAWFWRKVYEDLERVAEKRGQSVPRLDEAFQLIERWEKEAEALEKESASLLVEESRIKASVSELKEINQMIRQGFVDFFRSRGRKDMPTDRNLFAGSSYEFEGVSGSTLPGIRFALDKGELKEAKEEADIYISALRNRVERLTALRQKIREIR